MRTWEQGELDTDARLSTGPQVGSTREHRVVSGDTLELFVRRGGAHAVEEHPHLGLPTLEVGAEDGRLVLVWDLDGPERFSSPSQDELAAPGGP